ncbi:MAG: hypothetical protein CME62_12000 [Halobacteriovoraceae bacterium]|nr:hypothetical protein [Halobacteriovoraceae bacterium]|tara:strand:- start:32790 stop:33155 length:366 start_codon:yes stop_codon:yes gene_type:complete
MKKQTLNLIEKDNDLPFGISLSHSQQSFITHQLNQLQERSPAHSKIKLFFTKRESCVKGTLVVKSYGKTFASIKAGTEPIQAYMLMQEDIDRQILEWKRTRFSDSVFKQIRAATHLAQKCS